jgi:structure-specific recognition protein 1
MGESIEYGDVLQEVRGAMNPGRLKLSSSNVIFKNIKTGKVEQFQGSDIEKAQWLLRARGHCLKIILQNGTVHRFDGMRESEFDRLAGFLSKNYEAKLEKIDLSYKGWNYGTAKFKGNSLSFEVDHKQAFEVPLGNVSHTTTLKNEVTLEFHQNDDAAVSLMEMRFHIPSDTTNSDKDPVQEFYKNVLNSADIIQVQGDAIATFQEVQCLTPRGRYDIKIYPTFLQLHGKTFDYKIPYTTILRLFLLPHRDGRQMFFVISLDPPIKQGQTRYPFLILLFNKEEESTIQLELSEEDIQEKYEGKLAKEMSGPEYEIISRVFKALVNRKITVPGSFMGASGSHSIACSYKAATGFLYPLERGLIFVHKPPIHIRFDEVSSVNFARSTGANTRSFDFDVETKAGTVFTFVGIEKDEYGKLYDFISQKKLRVKNIGDDKGSGKVSYDDDLLDSEEEDNHDAYLHRMKAEGKQRVEAGEDDLMDSDDSSDESFAPPESGSEVAEEYDSNPETTSSDDSDEDYSASGTDAEEEREKRRIKKDKEREQKRKEKEKKKKVKTVSEKPRKKRQKKEKDPDKPKRAATAYMLWLNDVREEIKNENPGISITELTKLAGERWRNLDDKTKWEELAKEAKEQYMVAMAEYKKKAKDEPSKSASSSPKAKKKSSPRKPSGDTRAGAGDSYKSKEFISSSGSSDSSSDEDKPLKKKKKDKKQDEDEEMSSEASSENEASASGSASGDGSD